MYEFAFLLFAIGAVIMFVALATSRIERWRVLVIGCLSLFFTVWGVVDLMGRPAPEWLLPDRGTVVASYAEPRRHIFVVLRPEKGQERYYVLPWDDALESQRESMPKGVFAFRRGNRDTKDPNYPRGKWEFVPPPIPKLEPKEMIQ